MKKRRSKKKNIGLLILLLVGLALLGGLGVGGAAFLFLRYRDSKGGLFGHDFKSDPALARDLQESEYVLERSRLKLKLPRGFQETIRRPTEHIEEYVFLDPALRDRKVGSFPDIWIEVAFVPEGSWKNVSSDLISYLEKAVIPALQRQGVTVTRRDPPETGTINGVKFLRAEVDGRWPGRTDRYVLYFGTSRPHLITVRCRCPVDQLDTLPVLEASVRTLRR
jgi:hypothetical protein